MWVEIATYATSDSAQTNGPWNEKNKHYEGRENVPACAYGWQYVNKVSQKLTAQLNFISQQS